jgi:hypothetical protein
VQSDQNLPESALSGPVFAEQRVTFAGADLEADVLQGDDTRKTFRDVVKDDQVRVYDHFSQFFS